MLPEILRVGLTLVSCTFSQKFYVNGVKLIYKRGIEVREVNDRVKAGGAPMTWIETKRARVFYSDVRKLASKVLYDTPYNLHASSE